MMRLFIIVVVIFLSGFSTQAQDSLAIYQARFIQHLDSISGVELLASLADSSVMVGKEDMQTFLYVKNQGCWMSWSIEDECEADFMSMRLRLRLERKDINHKGRPEILIWWESEAGISTTNHGWSEEQKGVQLWDVDKSIRLLDLVYEERVENWSLQTETPFEQAILEDSLGKQKSYELYDEWFFYSLEINSDSLVISKLKAKETSSQNAEIAEIKPPIQEGTFKLVGDHFVKREKK